MKQKVLNCWKGKKSNVYKVEKRIVFQIEKEMPRSAHNYGRSQCRSTHKRQDC